MEAEKKGISPISGTEPPAQYRFKPGHPGGPGRPKGACPRAALARAMARNPDADGMGAKSVEVAEQILDAAILGDTDKVKALATLIAEVEGKPKEFVEHSGGTTQVIIECQSTPDAEMPA